MKNRRRIAFLPLLLTLALVLGLFPVTVLADPPGPPTALTATAGNGQITLGWTAPESNGDKEISDYKVFVDSGSGFDEGTLTGSTGTTHNVTGLTNGTEYIFKVAAVNEDGTGEAFQTTTGTPAATAPGAPTGLTATPGDTQVTLSWTAPESNGGADITSYKVFVKTDGDFDTGTLTNSTTTTHIVDNLSNDTAYTFKVAAVNSVGDGTDSDIATATPVAPTAPDAPTGLSATAGDTKVTLSWTAPTDNGGADITNYKVFVKSDGDFDSGTLTDSTATTHTVTGLNNGTAYTFKVAAVNSEGAGAESDTATATPAEPTAPGAPTGLTATAGNAQVSLSWTAPDNVGGADITDYKVFVKSDGDFDSGTLTDSTATTYTVTGLTNGTAYTFKVAAVNSVGTGADSNPASATPTDTPTPTPTAIPPTLTGPTAHTLTEGYEATSTGAFTLDGDPVPTVTAAGNAKITWNSTTNKLDIAAGLEVGSYPVTLTATNGEPPDATLTFTLTVEEEPETGTEPSITGPTAMTLEEGYSATSTGAYTVGGEPAPTVTATGSDKITWNNATAKLIIASGLKAGSYSVTLTAANGVEPNATLTFTLTVKAKEDPDPTDPPVPETGDPGWLETEDGEWFYYDPEGDLVDGWTQIDSQWYFFGDRSALETGWVRDGEGWFFMREDGGMATGWIWDGGGWYYMRDFGAAATGWLQDGDRWYFLNENGTMVTGWAHVGGIWYFLQADGTMATSWAFVNGSWYFLNDSGAMVTGWAYVNGIWYYMLEGGAMGTGEIVIDGQRNLFDPNGVWLGVV